MLESNDFHPGRTGRDHLRALAFAAEISTERVDEVLQLVELAESADRRVRTYSLGTRQRLGLAASLLGDPDLLVLDEPSNGLDPAGMRWLRGLLRGFAEEGRAVLISSHGLAELAQAVDAWSSSIVAVSSQRRRSESSQPAGRRSKMCTSD